MKIRLMIRILPVMTISVSLFMWFLSVSAESQRLTMENHIVPNTGENNLPSAVVDRINGYAYFGTNTAPGKIIKIDLSDFSRVGSITLNTDESYLNSGVLDPVDGYAYFGTRTTPGRVVKIDLATFNRFGAITFETGEDKLFPSVIDVGAGFAYFGTYTSPGKVIKLGCRVEYTDKLFLPLILR
jgi:hypothetical protein